MKTIAFIISLLIFCLVFTSSISTIVKADGIEEDTLVPGWSKDIRLTNDSADSMHPNIAVDSDGTIYIVWEDARNVWGGGYWGIYFTKSNNCGKSWETPTRINAPSNDGHTPSIIVDQNDVIHLVWRGAPIEENYYEIYYKNSTDGGNTWSDDVRLTYAPDDSFMPRIASYENTLHVVWSDKRNGNFEIYYKRSTDTGRSWCEDVRLTNAEGDSSAPIIAVDTLGICHIVWQDTRGGNYSVYYKKIMNNSFSEDVWLAKSSDKTIGNYPNPAICTDFLGNLHVVWADYRLQNTKSDVFYKKSVDNGVTWETEVNITQPSATDSYMVSIATDPQNSVYVVWKCSIFNYLEGGWYRTGNDLYYTKCSNNKINETAYKDIIRLTYVTNNTRMYPKLAFDNSCFLHMVWFDDRDGNMEIYYKRTLNPVTELPIVVTQTLNISTCKVGSSVTVSGNAKWNNTPVISADVSVKIIESNAEWTTSTDSSGNYNITITAPDTVGNYTIRVTVTLGNRTGTKYGKLIVETESVTNGGVTNGGVQGDGEAEEGFNIIYLVIIGAIAVGIIVAFALLRMRKPEVTKVEKPEEKRKIDVKFSSKIQTMTLRCPKCRITFSVEVKPKPFGVKCPHCGKEGTIK